MYLLSGKIKCAHCGKTFRGLTERKKKKYICSTYHNNSSSCIRHTVEEKALIDLVVNHWEITMIKRGIGLGGGKTGKKRAENPFTLIDIQKMIDYVKVVNINPVDGSLEILYQDNTNTLISQNRLTY